MDVSFIIPALDEEKMIGACLKSIKSQKTKLKFEIIVADGNSKDNTVKIAKKFAKVVRCKRKGIAYARNLGAKKAKGKLLVFIDADTTLPTDYLEKVWKYMNENPEVSALTARIKYDFSHGYLNLAWSALELVVLIQSAIGKARLTGINTVVWKDLFEKTGMFPEVPSEDVAFTSQMRKVGKTKYFRKTHVVSSARRFEKDPIGVIPYYLLRDVVTFAETHKSKSLKKASDKIGKKADYKEIR
ncbi:MAG: glycosyltransferase [Candidatus Altiarchaeota archaeon]|nr:glycosyltransferase [Candidatus Altiarchaeota archaeon]